MSSEVPISRHLITTLLALTLMVGCGARTGLVDATSSVDAGPGTPTEPYRGAFTAELLPTKDAWSLALGFLRTLAPTTPIDSFCELSMGTEPQVYYPAGDVEFTDSTGRRYTYRERQHQIGPPGPLIYYVPDLVYRSHNGIDFFDSLEVRAKGSVVQPFSLTVPPAARLPAGNLELPKQMSRQKGAVLRWRGLPANANVQVLVYPVQPPQPTTTHGSAIVCTYPASSPQPVQLPPIQAIFGAAKEVWLSVDSQLVSHTQAGKLSFRVRRQRRMAQEKAAVIP